MYVYTLYLYTKREIYIHYIYTHVHIYTHMCVL